MPFEEASPSRRGNEAAGMIDAGSGVWLHSPVVSRSVAGFEMQPSSKHHEDLTRGDYKNYQVCIVYVLNVNDYCACVLEIRQMDWFVLVKAV